ncbi:MAG: radical SAM protein [Candidatus Delongbacteria bacterium]|nr:radical SAM protein [Candidatus Delongbacteria bacterium]
MGLLITEIFESLQGESSYSGLPCLFIRTAGCNLRCRWCDTKYSYGNGKEYTSAEIIEIINSSKIKTVEFTGGEPLLQKDELINIIKEIDPDKTILLETNGSISVEDIPERVIKIIDIKLKGSGEGGSFFGDNLKFLTKKDEIKFVISDIFDYNEMRTWYEKHDLAEKCRVLVSIVKGCGVTDKEIAEKILNDGLNVRYQIQLHKHIWEDEKGR